MSYLVKLPIEVSKRELYPKLYLAFKAIDRGCSSLIYDHNNKFVDHRIKSNIYIYKDHATSSVKRLQRIRRITDGLYCHDEEGMIIDDDERYKSFRVSREAINLTDRCFLWGEEQYEKVVSAGILTDKLLITGAPRFDFLKRLTSVKVTGGKKQLKTVLINTRFGSVNGIRTPDEEKSNMLKLGAINDERSERSWDIFIESERYIFSEFLSLIKFLAVRNDYNVIIRPHPSEDASIYFELTKQAETIRVDIASELHENLYEADIVIHDGCTTAIEAAVMDIPSIALRPNINKHAYNDFANSVSIEAIDAASVVKLLESSTAELHDRWSEIRRSAKIDCYLNNYTNDVDSCDKMLDEIIPFIERSKTVNIITTITLLWMRTYNPYFFYQLFSSNRLIINFLSKAPPLKSWLKRSRINSHKVSSLTCADLGKIESCMNELFPNTNAKICRLSSTVLLVTDHINE